jgi:hypothetical protein
VLIHRAVLASKFLFWDRQSRRKAAVEKRAKQIARMVLLVIDGLQTKTYEQSVEIFSNPGNVPSTGGMTP